MNKFLFIVSLFFVVSCTEKASNPEHITLEGGEGFEFTASTSGNKDYLWDFGDGKTSTEKSPTYAYSTPGIYMVTFSELKNGRLKRQINRYLVKVNQLYRPRVFGTRLASSGSYGGLEYDYLYASKESWIAFELAENEDPEDYSYEIIIDNTITFTSDMDTWLYSGINYQFTESGPVDLTFKVYDKNNVSDQLDTTVWIGEDESEVTYQFPDVHSASIGTVSQRCLIFYEAEDATSYGPISDKESILIYPGPSSSYNLFSFGAEEIWDEDLNTYWDYRGISMNSFGAVSDGGSATVTIPAFDDSDDFDELYVMCVIVGQNGIAFGEKIQKITPGAIASSEVFDLNYLPY